VRADYTEIFKDTATVEKYQQVVFAPDSYASAINKRQRSYLRKLAKRAFPYRRPVQHDFATGTGRAIRLLHGLVREAHGYDTSEAMLSKASELGAFAELHHIEATGEIPEPQTSEPPALVTIFRLLLNVEDEVRERAVGFAAKALRNYDAGLLVVENHGNRQSLRHLRHARYIGTPWFTELDHEEIAELLDRHGFTVVERRGFALFSRGWYSHRWLCLFATLLDDLAARTGWFSRWSVNVLYVARRTRATE
jgi:predicted TPR repeat methyltransferase